MRNLNYLNNKRIDLFGDGNLGDEFNGAFKINFQGSFYNVIASNGMGWKPINIEIPTPPKFLVGVKND